nr:unnamed protein product [Digitaria exilis]
MWAHASAAQLYVQQLHCISVLHWCSLLSIFWLVIWYFLLSIMTVIKEKKIFCSTMEIGGFVNWRGNLVKREVHGGVWAAWFIYFLTVVKNMVNVPISLNLVTYLRGTMHMGVSGSATTVTNYADATSGFALIGAFLSDSCITRSKTILLFGPLLFLMVMLAIYDRFIVPFLRKRTGYASGITHLQRIGIGFASMILASVIAAVVERKRKEAAVQMSLFWLAPQFFLLGVSNVTAYPGLLQFFNSEAPRGMKSIATALFLCAIGLASLLATLLVQAVNSSTRHGQKGGWLEGTSLNNSHLDRFYWVVAAVGLFGFVNYLYWANRYVYNQDPLIIDEPSVDEDSP